MCASCAYCFECTGKDCVGALYPRRRACSIGPAQAYADPLVTWAMSGTDRSFSVEFDEECEAWGTTK